MGLAFVCSSMGMLTQVLRWPDVQVAQVLTFTLCYIAGVTASAHALARRLGGVMPWRTAGALTLLTLVLQMWFSVADPQLGVRAYVINLGTMLILGLPLLGWRHMVVHNRCDHFLRWTYVLCIVVNLLRVVWLLPTSSNVPDEAFTRTLFWISVHFFAMVSGLMMAAALILSVVSAMVHILKQERDLDPLTRLLHRRAFQEKLRMLEHEAPQRWMLLLCDLDHFKWVNERWGTAAGDSVLQVAAQLLQRNVRTTDVVARLGGEEFAVLLAGGDMTTALQVAERIRREMALMRLPMLVGERVTMSIGVTLVKSLEPQSLDAAMAHASQLLLGAKRAGRNRVRGDVPAALHGMGLTAAPG